MTEALVANDLIRPTTLAGAMALAKVLADSELVPKEFRGKPANCLVAMQMGAEIGLNPFQALQSIAVINGKPSIYGDAGLGVVMASGLLESIEETDDGEAASCTLRRKGQPNPVLRQFSAADAQRIQMYEKDANGQTIKRALGSRVMWTNHPKRMRQMRARWWAMRDLFPDVLKGLRGAEEMEEATIIDVTPTLPGAEPFPELMPREVGPAEPEILPSTVVPPEVTPAMTVPDPALTFELNGVQYQTAGVTKDQMLTMFDLGPKANKKQGDKGYDKKMLVTEFGVTTRKDLTAEAAEKYIIRLVEVIEAE